MVASTFTPNLRIEQPPIGGDQNVWGGALNNCMTTIDEAIAGVVTVNVAGSANVTLAAPNGTVVGDQARSPMVILIGAITANINVIIPSVSKMYWFVNQTTGAFQATITTGSGTTVALSNTTLIPAVTSGNNVPGPSAYTQFIGCDGVNVFELHNFTNAAVFQNANITGGAINGVTLDGGTF